MPLVSLVAVWITGRDAVTLSADIGWGGRCGSTRAFLVAGRGGRGREIVGGAKLAEPQRVALVGCSYRNVAFHPEAHFRGAADFGIRIGIAVSCC